MDVIIGVVVGFVAGRIIQFFKDTNRGIGPRRDGEDKR